MGDLKVARADQTASLLPDGRVIVAGGFDESGASLTDTEVFDPARNTFRAGPVDASLGARRHRDGLRGVAGGRDAVDGGTAFD